MAGPWEAARGGAGLLEGRAGQGGRAAKGRSGAEPRWDAGLGGQLGEPPTPPQGLTAGSSLGSALWPVPRGLAAAWAAAGTDAHGGRDR